MRWEVTMSKQTATEYLIQEIKNDTFIHSKSTKEWNEVFRKAKQMEREQKIEFAKKWEFEVMYNMGRVLDSAENFYNETYGGQDEK